MEFAEMANLKITLLGGFEMRRANGAVVDILGQKDRGLLAFLAITSGDTHPRERLAGMLWSERGDRQARDSLKQSLVRLRRYLDTVDYSALRTDRQSIGLDPNLIGVDTIAFERLVRYDTIDALTQAIALYHGDLLQGIAIHDPVFEDWLLVERQRLRQLFERALSSLMTQALGANDADTAAEAARRLILLDPLSEAAYRTLMQVHVDNGQTAQALKLYESLFERLYRELSVRPEPSTVALHDSIRERRTTAAAVSDALVSVPTPPSHRDASLTEGKPSVAVLPFVNMSGDPEQQYLSDGITEDIITELSRFQTLFVMARNSSSQFQGDLDVTRIGRELGVRYLAEGSVRQIGERLRINAQLVDATNGNHLWAEHYDRDALDMLAVQDEIVRAIATALGHRLEAAGRDRALRMSPQALSAYDYVLRSEALLNRFNRDDNVEARRLAESAVALDPKSALAHTQLGWTRCMDYISGWVEDRAGALEAAFAAARRAVLLDDADCRARWLLGNVHIYRREFDEARYHLRKAIALNPNDVEARGIYAFYLIAVGEIEAALDQFDFAKRYNPFEFNWMTWYRGIALFTARRYDEAIATLKEVHNPNNEVRLWLAASYGAAGCLPEAHAMLAEFLAEAEHDMARFPGRDLESWKPHLHAAIEYRDPAEFDHLFEALRTAGLK
jgi:TolB-like protein/Tfp pilus assembly protein PilF